jgi:hypothetical protein
MDTKPSRKTFSFPKAENFFNRVHDRLHMVVERFVFADKKNAHFTLIVNAIPRDKPEEITSDSPVPLKYVSMPQQRTLLEGKNKVKELNEAWKALDQRKLESSNAEEGEGLWRLVLANKFCYRNILKGDASEMPPIYQSPFSDDEIKQLVEKKTLESYFDGPVDPKNDAQPWEKKILSHHFKIESQKGTPSDCYIAIPLIQFGNIDGFVYLIYQDEDHHRFDQNNIMDLVIGFSDEYEEVIISWDLTEEEYDRTFAFRQMIKDVCGKRNQEFFKDKNPIFRELNYPEYYNKHKKYYKRRFEQHDKMLSLHYDQMIRHGSTTILLDSFAHNISAHALTTLTWIFKKRSKLKLKQEQMAKIEEMFRKLQKEIPAAIRNKYTYVDEEESISHTDLIGFGGSLTREIFPFLKFLQEKGGFWSGLTRDLSFGGQVNTFYSILWYDFVYNALYLGTIAESEQIRKLHIDITLYDETLINVSDDTKFTRKMPKAYTRRFATIDLGGKSVEHFFDPKGNPKTNSDGGDWYVIVNKKTKKKIWHEELQGLENISRFVQLGEDFMELRDKLRDIKIFFPGSVVGKHAFFTMIENELRNIKHYFGKDAENILTKDEMTLNISIQPASLGNNKSTELYQLGLWIGYSTKLTDHTRSDKKPFLVKRRFEMLWQDILDENTKQPRLGGNSQDKVCAAMLFNNSFSSVQFGSFRTKVLETYKEGNNRTLEYAKRDAIFYPWITPAVCYDKCDVEFRVPAPSANFEIKYVKETGGVSYNEQETQFDTSLTEAYKDYEKKYTHAANGFGVLKKYLFLWKGEPIRSEHDNQEMTLDHLGRFKFVIAHNENDPIWKTARENGVIRLIPPLEKPNGEKNNGDLIIQAYMNWFKIWFDEPMALTFEDEGRDGKGGAEIGTFIFDKTRTPCLSFHSDFISDGDTRGGVKFRLTQDTRDLTKKLITGKKNVSQIICAHNRNGLSPNVVRYRSHGVIYQHFMPEEKLSPYLSFRPIAPEKMPELFEFMATKVCLFDNRLFNRADKNRMSFYENKLKLFFCPELKMEMPDGKNSPEWGDETCHKHIKNTHFLIIHLSFIDRILRDYHSSHKDYEEGNIGLFIQEELFDLVHNADKTGLRDNFILIVTTGRGRQNWHKFLDQDQYKRFKKSVIFRPIESLIAAMEDSLMLNDDIDLKYRIVKALFGS